MLASIKQQYKPSEILYSMIRVTDLERSVSFYQEVLGMKEIRRETFSEGRFTLVFMGYENSAKVTLELTYNWDEAEYLHGSGYGHLALGIEHLDLFFEQLDQTNITVIRQPGPMSFAEDKTGHRENIAFILDPDGYKIELIQV